LWFGHYRASIIVQVAKLTRSCAKPSNLAT
jgi:hypothetical protein